MIELGAAFKCAVEPYHRILIISDPQANGGWVVAVRITTDTEFGCDKECILDPDDWQELRHRSAVAFSHTKFGKKVAELEAMVQTGQFRKLPSPPFSTLKKILRIARVSENIPVGAIQWLPELD